MPFAACLPHFAASQSQPVEATGKREWLISLCSSPCSLCPIFPFPPLSSWHPSVVKSNRQVAAIPLCVGFGNGKASEGAWPAWNGNARMGWRCLDGMAMPGGERGTVQAHCRVETGHAATFSCSCDCFPIKEKRRNCHKRRRLTLSIVEVYSLSCDSSRRSVKPMNFFKSSLFKSFVQIYFCFVQIANSSKSII